MHGIVRRPPSYFGARLLSTSSVLFNDPVPMGRGRGGGPLSIGGEEFDLSHTPIIRDTPHVPSIEERQQMSRVAYRAPSEDRLSARLGAMRQHPREALPEGNSGQFEDANEERTLLDGTAPTPVPVDPGTAFIRAYDGIPGPARTESSSRRGRVYKNDEIPDLPFFEERVFRPRSSVPRQRADSNAPRESTRRSQFQGPRNGQAQDAGRGTGIVGASRGMRGGLRDASGRGRGRGRGGQRGRRGGATRSDRSPQQEEPGDIGGDYQPELAPSVPTILFGPVTDLALLPSPARNVPSLPSQPSPVLFSPSTPDFKAMWEMMSGDYSRHVTKVDFENLDAQSRAILAMQHNSTLGIQDRRLGANTVNELVNAKGLVALKRVGMTPRSHKGEMKGTVGGSWPMSSS